MALAHTASAALVFQADFNGTGSGTGGASDMVTLGGTGQFTGTSSSSNVYSSISSSTPLTTGGGNYLSLDDQGQSSSYSPTGAGFSPNSAASSFDSWYTDNGTSGFDTLNGGVDFFFRSTDVALSTNQFRFLALYGISGSDGLRFNLLSNNGALRFEFLTGSSSAVSVGASSGILNLSANTTYHIASTMETDGSTGLITVKLFLAEGNTAIDTSSNTYLIASATSSSALDDGSTDTITQSFNSANGFTFGQYYNDNADTKVTDLDQFRIYDSIPAEFSAIPEPETLALNFGSIALLAAFGLKRRARSIK